MNFNASKVAKSRVILLSGDEDQLRSRAISDLLAESGVQKDDFDLEYRDGDGSLPSEWLAMAGTAPFLGDRRVLIVRHLLRCDPDLMDAASLANLPDSAMLILVADEEVASDDKSRKQSTWRTKWEKMVTKAGGVTESFQTDPKTVKSVLKVELAKSGKSISDKAAETLIEMVGGSLSRALDELDKLILFCEVEQIRDTDVREVVVPSRDWNVFKMIDAICAGSPPEALRQLRILLGSKTKAEEAGIAKILPMTSRQIRLLWQARVCFEANCNPSNPTDAVRAMLPIKPNIMQEKPYRHSSLMALARRVDLVQLALCLDIIRDTDARLKGSLASFSGFETMERMVLDMSQVLAPKITAGRR